jgi:hypothetical protein
LQSLLKNLLLQNLAEFIGKKIESSIKLEYYIKSKYKTSLKMLFTKIKEPPRFLQEGFISTYTGNHPTIKSNEG